MDVNNENDLGCIIGDQQNLTIFMEKILYIRRIYKKNRTLEMRYISCVDVEGTVIIQWNNQRNLLEASIIFVTKFSNKKQHLILHTKIIILVVAMAENIFFPALKIHLPRDHCLTKKRSTFCEQFS